MSTKVLLSESIESAVTENLERVKGWRSDDTVRQFIPYPINGDQKSSAANSSLREKRPGVQRYPGDAKCVVEMLGGN